ncbi:hypothetical protein [Idiomarina sp. UBA3162]|uniref:hypothetical protein n=1 Tax=unclassified Idiomarina TaxID=2614829 RepID=UPI000C98FE54|nr:hypothetical protein [Idiomarina sp. UBA3162]MAD52748.1 hypothetical protein [Idiomarinaceae bacterium]MEC7642308.1 hypothetical protein [Pseudomonadota bacterium]
MQPIASQAGRVSISIDRNQLLKLMQSQAVVACDLKACDANSQSCLKQLVLECSKNDFNGS